MNMRVTCIVSDGYRSQCCTALSNAYLRTGTRPSKHVWWLLQEVANAARKRAAGLLEASTFMEVEAAPEAAAALSAEDAAAQAEQQYAAELQKELTGRAGADTADTDEQPEAPEQATKVHMLTCSTVGLSKEGCHQGTYADLQYCRPV